MAQPFKRPSHARSASEISSNTAQQLTDASKAVERFNALVKLSKSNLHDVNEEIGGAVKLTNFLHSAFSSAGNDFVSSLEKGLEIVVQISKLLQLAQSGGAGGVLPFFEGFTSLFALFDGGGYTGNIPGNVPAGIVHGGEIVFEKSLVDAHGSEILSLRQALQRGSSFGDILAGLGRSAGSFSMGDLSPLLSEVRLLRAENKQLTEAVKNLEIQTPVVLQGTLSGQQFLRKEMPGFASYDKKKRV